MFTISFELTSYPTATTDRTVMPRGETVDENKVGMYLNIDNTNAFISHRAMVWVGRGGLGYWNYCGLGAWKPGSMNAGDSWRAQ